ncbi:MAG: hypothetical protein AAB452_02205 [Patescibacteria group bacterium]
MDQDSSSPLRPAPLPTGQAGLPTRPGLPPNLPTAGNIAPTKPEGIDLRFPEPAFSATPAPSQPNVSSSLTAPVRPQAPTPSQPAEYKTSIRTMAADIAKLKVGQKPSGTEIQKTIPAQQKPLAPVVPAPQLNPIPPRSQVMLCDTEKTKPLAPASPFSRPVPPVKAPGAYAQTTLPESQSRHRSRTALYFTILFLVIAGAGVFFYFNGKDEEVALTPTPRATTSILPTPTPTPTIGSLIGGGSETIILSATGDPATDFLSKINALTLNPSEMRKIVITGQTKGSGDLGLTDLLDRFLINYPAAIKSSLGTDSVILAYGQKEIFTSKGQLDLNTITQKRLIFLMEVKDQVTLNQALQSWEPTIIDSLASVLSLTKTKAAGIGFTSNAYAGTNIRYRNYPYPDRSIDYALLPASNGKTYLLIAGSRESTLLGIDKVKSR